MAQPPPAKRQKCNEDNDVLEVRGVRDGDGGMRTIKFFKYLTVHYAPKFATVIQFPGVKPIELTHFTYFTLRLFNGWLRSSWLYDRHRNRLPKYTQGWEPKWELLGEDILSCYWETPLSGFRPSVLHAIPAMVNAFLFAETYDIPRLRHDALDQLVRCFRENNSTNIVSVQTVKDVYANTQDGSPLRRVLVDGFCFQTNLGRMPEDFLVDVGERTDLGKTALDCIPNACEYHEHETGARESCDSCESRVFQDPY